MDEIFFISGKEMAVSKPYFIGPDIPLGVEAVSFNICNDAIQTREVRVLENILKGLKM